MFKSTFTNELGNTIAITVARTDAGRIRVVMTGPSSTCDHTYTREEAMQLLAGLFAAV